LGSTAFPDGAADGAALFAGVEGDGDALSLPPQPASSENAMNSATINHKALIDFIYDSLLQL
jgi:hypothetical protein